MTTGAAAAAACPSPSGGLARRTATALALLPLLLVVALAPAWGFFLLVLAAALLATREVALLHRRRGAAPLLVPTLLAVALVHLAFAWPERLPLDAALFVGAGVLIGWHLLLGADSRAALPAVAASMASVLVPGLLLAFLVRVHALGGQPGGAVAGGGFSTLDGPGLVLFLLAVVFGNDAAAYFGGGTFGRLKLAPRLSPGKTVEGFLCGLAGGVAAGAVAAFVLRPGLSQTQVFQFGFLLSLAAVFGDLVVSAMKRSAEVKDTGSLLPGHGGVLDRLDGLLFSGPLLYLLLSVPVEAPHRLAGALADLSAAAGR